MSGSVAPNPAGQRRAGWRLPVWQDALVDLLPCGHVAVAGPSRMCRHLLGSEGEDHVRLLTGRGLGYDLCCSACDRAALDGNPPELVSACEGCVTRCTEDDWYTLLAWRGEPEILTRPAPLDPAVVDVPLPVAAVDLVPVAAGTRPVWLLLAADSRIGRFDADSGAWDLLAQATVPDEPGHRPWCGHRLRRRLHACPLGRFAALVNDYGHHGQVIDLRTEAPTSPCTAGVTTRKRCPSRWRSPGTGTMRS